MTNQVSLSAYAPVVSINNGKPTTSSNDIAQLFQKQHKHVLEKISALIAQLPSEFNEPNFRPVEYIDAKGEKRASYQLTRDGFTLLAMGFTGKKALEFKLAYIEAFNKMEAELHKVKAKPTTKALPNCLTVEQQKAIQAIVKTRVDLLPEDKRAKGAITLWSALKSKFGASYKEIPESEFSDALSLVTRIVIEGEILDAEPKGMKPLQWTRLTDDITSESGYAIIGDVKNWVSENLPHDIGCDFFDAMHDLQRVIVRGTTEMQESIACFKMGIRYLNRFRGVNTR